MACKCQDTGSKVCRQERFHTGMWEWEQHQQVRVDRKRTNTNLHRAIWDLNDDNAVGPVVFVPVEDDPDESDLDSYGLYDYGCWCRRCLIHGDPGGCLVVEAAYNELKELAGR